MHKETPKDDPDMLAQMRYETRDFSFGAVGKFVFGTFLFAFLGFLAAFGIFKWMNPGILENGKVSQPFAMKGPEAPNPILQTNVTAKSDIEEIRKNEMTQMRSYGNSDAPGTVSVPIERALQQVAQDGIQK